MSSAPVRQWTRFMLRRAMQEATVIVAPVHELERFGAAELSRKTSITSTVNDERIAQFKRKGVDMVIDGAPAMFGHVLSPSLLDAMIIATLEKEPTRFSRTTTSRSSPASRWSHASSTRAASSGSTASPSSSIRCRREYFKEHQARRAAVPRVAARLHGHAGEGDGLRAAVRLLEGDGHQSPPASKPRAG